MSTTPMSTSDTQAQPAQIKDITVSTNDVPSVVYKPSTPALHNPIHKIHPMTTDEHDPKTWFTTGEQRLLQMDSAEASAKEAAALKKKATSNVERLEPPKPLKPPKPPKIPLPPPPTILAPPVVPVKTPGSGSGSKATHPEWSVSSMHRKDHILAPIQTNPKSHPHYNPGPAGTSATPVRTTKPSTKPRPPPAKSEQAELAELLAPIAAFNRSEDEKASRLPPHLQPPPASQSLRHLYQMYERGTLKDMYFVFGAKGSTILLPANEYTSRYAGLETPGYVDVRRLAQWAAQNDEWAEYLRTGGGNEEAWWMYRRMKGLPGYKVSGFEEKWGEVPKL